MALGERVFASERAPEGSGLEHRQLICYRLKGITDSSQRLKFTLFLCGEHCAIGNLILEEAFSTMSEEEEIHSLDEPVISGVFKQEAITKPLQFSGLPPAGAVDSGQDIAVLDFGLDVDLVAYDPHTALGEPFPLATPVNFFKQVEESHFMISPYRKPFLTNRLHEKGDASKIDRRDRREVEIDSLLDLDFEWFPLLLCVADFVAMELNSINRKTEVFLKVPSESREGFSDLADLHFAAKQAADVVPL